MHLRQPLLYDKSTVSIRAIETVLLLFYAIALCPIQRLLEIREDIVDILDADG